MNTARTRKYPSIDIIKLFSRGTTQGWNATLNKALKSEDHEGLRKLYYGMQCGMDDAVKQNLTHDKLRIWYVRALKSVEITAKKIFKKKFPSPCDDPLFSKHVPDNVDINVEIDNKRRRDQAFEQWMIGSMF